MSRPRGDNALRKRGIRDGKEEGARMRGNGGRRQGRGKIDGRRRGRRKGVKMEEGGREEESKDRRSWKGEGKKETRKK